MNRITESLYRISGVELTEGMNSGPKVITPKFSNELSAAEFMCDFINEHNMNMGGSEWEVMNMHEDEPGIKAFSIGTDDGLIEVSMQRQSDGEVDVFPYDTYVKQDGDEPYSRIPMKDFLERFIDQMISDSWEYDEETGRFE